MQGGGVHLVDLMTWLTGQYPGHVAAVGNRICTEGSGRELRAALTSARTTAASSIA
jgi:hypothetical protein